MPRASGVRPASPLPIARMLSHSGSSPAIFPAAAGEPTPRRHGGRRLPWQPQLQILVALRTGAAAAEEAKGARPNTMMAARPRAMTHTLLSARPRTSTGRTLASRPPVWTMTLQAPRPRDTTRPLQLASQRANCTPDLASRPLVWTGPPAAERHRMKTMRHHSLKLRVRTRPPKRMVSMLVHPCRLSTAPRLPPSTPGNTRRPGARQGRRRCGGRNWQDPPGWLPSLICPVTCPSGDT